MKCREIIEIIERAYPKEYALEWDNVGLLAGSCEKQVGRIYVALDATDEVIEDAVSKHADMLVTHHPLIFGGLKRITDDEFTGRRLIRLIQNDISCYAVHTNYDVLGMADLAAAKLGLTDAEVLEVTREYGQQEGIGRVADLKDTLTLKECCEWVKKSFFLDTVKVSGEMDMLVNRAAISPGSGKSMIDASLKKGADVLITGDIDHHTGIDAAAQGLALIDAGHYGLEHIFIEDMQEYLSRELDDTEVLCAPLRRPFIIY